jgi:hypothetical protein
VRLQRSGRWSILQLDVVDDRDDDDGDDDDDDSDDAHDADVYYGVGYEYRHDDDDAADWHYDDDIHDAVDDRHDRDGDFADNRRCNDDDDDERQRGYGHDDIEHQLRLVDGGGERRPRHGRHHRHHYRRRLRAARLRRGDLLCGALLRPQGRSRRQCAAHSTRVAAAAGTGRYAAATDDPALTRVDGASQHNAGHHADVESLRHLLRWSVAR